MINARKLMAILLLVAILCGLMPAAAFADEINNEPMEQSQPATEQDSVIEAEPNEQSAGEEGDEEDALQPENEEAAPMETAVANELAAGNVAYVTNTGNYYTSLSDAIGAVSSTGEIQIIADCTVDSPIVISSNDVTITNSGDPHSIYFCNADSSKESGRGITVKTNRRLTISDLTLVGHSQDGSTYNYSSIIYATVSNGPGSVKLNNVTVTGCRPTSGGSLGTYSGTSKKGSITLNGCTISGNGSTGASGGAAVYNGGALYLCDGTVITNNCSKSEISGAIFCGDSSTISISGNVTVSGNYKNCSRGSSGTVYPDGDASDIYIPSANIISCEQTASGSIGIDSNKTKGDAFAKLSAAATAAGGAPFFSDSDSSLLARYAYGSTDIKWRTLAYFDAGSLTASGQSYKYSSANLIYVSDSLTVSVAVDSGSFTLPTLPVDAKGYAICNGQLCFFDTAANFPTGTISAITISSGWTSTTAQAFIQEICFTPKAYGVAQKASFGFSDEVPAGSYLFGNKLYRYSQTAVTRDNAYAAADSAGERLVCVSDATINAFVSGLTVENGCRTGGALISDQWYFPDGTRFGASAVSSQGYENAFTAWAANEPASGGFYMYAKKGSWYADDGSAGYGYISEKSALCGAEATGTVYNSQLKTRLDSYSLALEGGIAVNYYFTFAPDFSALNGSYISIAVGNQEPVIRTVSEIMQEGNKASHNAGAYGVTIPVEPKNMNATTLISFYYPDGTLYGRYGGAGRNNYNVRSYALTVIDKQNTGDAYNSGFSSDLVALVKAMLNYGAAAESQFGTAGGLPTNEGCEDTSELTASGSISGAYFTHTNSGISYTLSLFAESDTLMRIMPSVTGFSATVDGAAADCSQGYIDIPVSMQDLGHVYSLNFSGGFEDELQINVLKVIQAILGAQSDDAKLTADRLYKMGLAADKYFGSYVPATSAVQAVLNTAYAYLAKTEYTQYDQGSLTTANYTNHPNNRRQLHASPEEATQSSSIYMDCSSFVYNVYREVFGADAVQAALNLSESDMNTKSMIYGTDSAKILLTEAIRVYTASCDEMNFEEFRAALQPGDLIVKYNIDSSHGHVVLWTGTGYIHCTGASYDYDTGTDKIEEEGAVYYVPDAKFTAYFYDGFDDVTILRPLMKLGDSALQTDGTARQQLGGLSVSKTASVNGKLIYPGIGVNPGDEITYTITVENPRLSGTLNLPRTIDITDTLPEGLVLSSGSLSHSNVSVGVGETKTLSYTATVTAEAGAVIPATTGTLQSSAAGSSAGIISFSGIRISVEAPAADAVSAIVKEAKNYIDGIYPGADAEAVYDLLNTIYSDALGVENALPGDQEAWVSQIFGMDKSETYYYARPYADSYWSSKLVANFASGRKVLNYSYGGGYFDYDTRVRNLSSDNLMPGDLLCVHVPTLSAQFKYYIYIGDGLMVSFIPGSDCADVQANDVLSNLLNKTCFAVFRLAGRVS